MKTYRVTATILSAISLLFLLAFPSSANAGIDDDHLKIGKDLYMRYCDACHGKNGKGDGINSQKMDPLPRDFTDSGKEKYMMKRSENEIFKAIALGGREIEKSVLMPAFGKTLSEHEIWCVVSYVSKLCETKSWNVNYSDKMSEERSKVEVKAVEIPEPGRRDKLMGKRTYGKYGCSGCHKINERGGKSGPELDGVATRLKPNQIYTIIQNAHSVKKDSAMPIYGLNEETAVSITKYLMFLE
jgi:cytochrome c oxidase cbb3-type subunit 3